MKYQEFIKDTSGSALAVTGLSLIMILASAAIAVDMGYAYMIKTRLQGTADFAAMAGVTELPKSGSLEASDEVKIKSRAQAYAALNMPAGYHGTVLANSDIEIGNWDSDTRIFTANAVPANAVQVVTRRSDDNGNSLGTFFGRVLGVTDVNINTTAIAALNASPSGECIVALKPNETGVSVNSNGDITTQNCGIHANSTDNNSIMTNSGGTITVNDGNFCTAGDYSGGGYDPPPDTGCETKPDPMAGQAKPPIPPCDHSDRVVVQDGETATLSPGRYCKGLEVNTNAHAIFEPGTYIIEGDKLTVNANSTAEGTGVTFYLEDKDATILFNQNSHVDFSAPTIGELAGILIFANPDISDETKHEINSDSGSVLNGTVYAPNSELMINSNGQLGGSDQCSNFLVGNLTVNADSSLFMGQDYETCGVPIPEELMNYSVQLVK